MSPRSIPRLQSACLDDDLDGLAQKAVLRAAEKLGRSENSISLTRPVQGYKLC